MSTLSIRFQHAKAPQFALILITIIWGGSFITVQYGLNFSSPILFVGFRFAAAAIAVMLISIPHLKWLHPQRDGSGRMYWRCDCDWLWYANDWLTKY